MMEPRHTLIAVEFKLGRATSTKTTLYELIEVIGGVVEDGEERLISQVILHLINSGNIIISSNLNYL